MPLNPLEIQETQKSLLNAFLHALALVGGYGLGYFLFENASFGLLTAWWLSLYVGFIANIRIAAVTPVAILYVAVLAADLLLNRGWFYAEGPSSSPVEYFAISLIYGLVIIASPILVNAFVRRILVRAQ